MSTILNRRQLLVIPLLAAAIAVVSASAASAQIEATAQTIAVTENNGLTDVQFKVTVTNGGASAAVNVVVVFADELQLSVGDVPAEGSAVSAKETRTIDVSATQTRSISVPVTLKFALDGKNVELTQTLYLTLGAPAGGQ